MKTHIGNHKPEGVRSAETHETDLCHVQTGSRCTSPRLSPPSPGTLNHLRDNSSEPSLTHETRRTSRQDGDNDNQPTMTPIATRQAHANNVTMVINTVTSNTTFSLMRRTLLEHLVLAHGERLLLTNMLVPLLGYSKNEWRVDRKRPQV